MFYNLHLPAQCCFDPLDEATLLVRTVSPHETQSRKAALEWLQEQFAALLILDVGFMHEQMQDHPSGIDEQVPLAPFHAFATVKAARPPFWLVFTDWLSIIAALGVGSRPVLTRTRSRKAVCICCQVPSLRQVRK
jgi:hypothetical protein